jgi:HK97 gp10 family phage protein
MPSSSYSVTIKSNRIASVQNLLLGGSRSVVDKAAGDIRDRAATSAPVDTGALRSSMYVSNGTTSDYSMAAGTARALNRDASILNEVRPEFVLSLFSGGLGYTDVVGSAVEYAVFNEFGTRYMSPSPFMIPAVEGNREPFIAAMVVMLKGLK